MEGKEGTALGMPNIPDIMPQIDLERDEALTLLLASIALEEIGLAHILNSEGEKLQQILKDPETCPEDLLAVNDSVERVLKSITTPGLCWTGSASCSSDPSQWGVLIFRDGGLQ